MSTVKSIKLKHGLRAACAGIPFRNLVEDEDNGTFWEFGVWGLGFTVELRSSAEFGALGIYGPSV